MDITAFLKALEATSLAAHIRASLFLFPMLESIHVVALALVFGTIAIIDLRLLGVASTKRPFQRMTSDILKWTWAAFALSAVTGALMFLTNARVYYENFYFRGKMLLLLLSGINMAVFELTAGRTSERWGQGPAVPRAGKIAGGLSIILWIGVIVMGRIIGFTTTRALATPPPTNVDFNNFLDAGPPGNGAAPAAPATPPGKK